MAVDIENNNEQSTHTTTETSELPQQNIPHRKVKKASKRRGNDVRHVSRKLIMAWKLASQYQNITWKEVAPMIDSVEFLSSHWKSDERLKSVEPVAIEIISQVNKIHLELNLRVFGMNRLRIITEEFLNLLKRERDEFVEKSKELDVNQEQSSEVGSTSPSTATENSKDEINIEPNTEKVEVTRKTRQKPLRTKEELLDRLILSLTQLYNLLNDPVDSTPVSPRPNSPRPSGAYMSPPQKHKTKKRNLFSGFFSSSDKKQSSSSSTTSSSINSPELSTTSIPSGLEVYKNNIVSEWQEYTRKFVEPNYLFKVCKCYLAANPSAIPEKARLIGQNWICIANEISMSLWNILKKREDDLASSLIFLTLYKHGSREIIERATNTIGIQLPRYLYVRLEYALGLKEFEQFTKEEQQMLDINYVPEEIQQQQMPTSPISLSGKPLHKKSNPDIVKRNGSISSKKDKKKRNSTSVKSDNSDEPLSFADMLAM